ncbi:MAG: hypothetical protein ABSG81_03820 [Acidimicrobiales bacterium]
MSRRRLAVVLVGVAALGVVAAVIVFETGSPPGRRPSTPTLATSAPTTPAPATSLSSSTTAPVTSTTVAATVAATLPVTVCPTTDGTPPPSTSVPVPSSLEVQVPSNLADTLAVYSDTQGFMKVVGPRAWSCTALLAADGSGGVAVYPPAQPLPPSWSSQWHLAAGSAVEAIVADETSACVGCTVGQACPLFASARSAYDSEIGRPCPTRPAQEWVGQESAGIVSFEDPPGVAGDGAPSGGADPANGIMTYYPQSPDGSWLETCTVPSSAGPGLCAAVLGDFLSRYGQK